MGRKKIEMKMVKDSSARQVTFSKRRNGLFKKANELATLCAAQVAIVVFSPGGKPFSFGNPSVDAVTQRFLNQDYTIEVDPEQEARVEKLSEELNGLLKQLHIEKKRGKMLDKALKESGASRSLLNINELGFDELVNLKAKLEELQRNLKGRVNEIEASSSLLLLKKVADEEDDD
ncbi:agamous-like MADS-box protein AGL29 [Pistacia vera]|uniref:agamous-like MADS-box protein AGL29 n=1 Tax=Pistacia vera TaxID=55513 RepID=UPI00126396E6|nr:agamous-like MADS-box protein AGL29 [Pistacia vera]